MVKITARPILIDVSLNGLQQQLSGSPDACWHKLLYPSSSRSVSHHWRLIELQWWQALLCSNYRQAFSLLSIKWQPPTPPPPPPPIPQPTVFGCGMERKEIGQQCSNTERKNRPWANCSIWTVRLNHVI